LEAITSWDFRRENGEDNNELLFIEEMQGHDLASKIMIMDIWLPIFAFVSLGPRNNVVPGILSRQNVGVDRGQFQSHLEPL
jgi:hypothetical protein